MRTQSTPELPARWWVRYWVEHVVSKLLVRLPILKRICTTAAGRLAAVGRLGEEMPRTEASIEMLQSSSPAPPQAFGSGFGYASPMIELGAALHFQQELESPGFEALQSDSSALYDAVLKTVGATLEKDRCISKVLNFGVSFAYIDDRLASTFPGVEFIGIDRSEQVRTLNSAHFKDRYNLSFIAGDVFDALQQHDFTNGLFFHMRTLTLLPYSFVLQLYRAVGAAGFSHICGFECWGVSRQLHAWYDVNDPAAESSVVFRGPLFLHHYPRALEAAGFHVAEFDLLQTRHPQPDYRVARFRAVNLNIAGRAAGRIVS